MMNARRRRARFEPFALFALFALSLASAAAVAAPRFAFAKNVARASSSTAPAPAARDTALFAGGCFWSMESAFEGRPGVVAAISGYSGGHTVNPTYDEVNTHTTGHLETVQVIYDPRRTTYAALLDVYWHSIDPTQTDGQFCDRGDSYYSAIFWRNDAQRNAAEASKRSTEAAMKGKPVATRLIAAGPFYRAEEYHQDYAKKNPEHYGMYRLGCRRDAQLRQVWGDKAAKPIAHP